MGVYRSVVLAVALAGVMPSPTFAQYAIPTELSLGLGAVKDWAPSQWSPSVVGAVAWDYEERWRMAFVVEGEVGTLSDTDRCQGAREDPPSSCMDGAVLLGLRARPVPYRSSGWRPFGGALVGGYWKGSGSDDEEFLSSHVALQIGGGVELRWANSIQGLRISLDYRHVFAGDRDRNQLRLLTSYVIGPRRFRTPGRDET